MSQGYTTNRKRRVSRAQRNRPALVTSTSATQQSEQTTQDTAVSVEEQPTPLTVPTPAPTTQQKPRRSTFFSTLGGTAEKVVDVTQARLARATQGKAAPAMNKTTEKNEKATTTKASQPAASRAGTMPARPTSPFKTRYIIGMGLYLIGASFIGNYETVFLRSMNLDSVLTQFNLFGGQVVVRTSTLLYLATLVLILVLLARFDLIPRSLSAVSGASTSRSRTEASRTSETAGGERTPPPTIRQGVKGADDKLYQEYRLSQRRERKK